MFGIELADGFSSVSVKVDREGDTNYAVHNFDFTATAQQQFVEWDFGQVPDITILTCNGAVVPGSIALCVIYNRAMRERLNGADGIYNSSLETPDGTILAILPKIDYPFEEETSNSANVQFGMPRLATAEGFYVGSSSYGLKAGYSYRITGITGLT